MIGSIFSAAICAKFGIKATMVLGGLNLTMVAISQILPALKAEYKESLSTPQFIEDITTDNVCIAILFLGSIMAGFG